MSSASAQDIARHMAALSLANQFEIEELRRTSIESKCQQTWTMMRAECLHLPPQERELEVAAVRARWMRLIQLLRA